MIESEMTKIVFMSMIDVMDVREGYQRKYEDKLVKEKGGRHKMRIKRLEQEKEYRETCHSHHLKKLCIRKRHQTQT